MKLERKSGRVVEIQSKAKRRTYESRTFDWKIHCLFCEKAINQNEKNCNRSSASFSCTETVEHRTQLLKYCEDRDDETAEAVKRRLLTCSDFPAVEARYHKHCRLEFKFPSKKENAQNLNKKGRPKSEMQMTNFNKLCDWLELEGELYSVGELYKKMEEIAEGDIYADERYLKQQLMQKYENAIF